MIALKIIGLSLVATTIVFAVLTAGAYFLGNMIGVIGMWLAILIVCWVIYLELEVYE